MTTPLLVFLVVSSLVTLGLLMWPIGSLRGQSAEDRRRALQVGAIAAAFVAVGLAVSYLL